jgi:hypothetical protein
VNLDEHAKLCSSLVRLGSRIGLDRIARDVTPTLSEYLARKRQLQPGEVEP